MYFKINLKSEDGKNFIIEKESRNLGYKDVVKVREELGFDVKFECIHGTIPSYKVYNETIYLNSEYEKYIKESKRFDENNEITIRVKGNLNDYVKEEVRYKQYETEDEGIIEDVRIDYVFDEEAFLRDWAGNGYPLYIERG